MEQSIIQHLIEDYGPVRWINKSVFGFKDEGWFLIETVPLPPTDQIEQVVSDILNNYEIDYFEGQVVHWAECKNTHKIKDRVIRKLIDNLKNERFRIGICTGDEKVLLGQPIVIALKPTISYIEYPDHPHLNTGGDFGNLYLSDSFCYGYTSEPDRYGPSTYDKFIRVFDESTLWLFRHQVWVEIRNEVGKGKWIGPGDKIGLPKEVYAGTLNPLGRCRCGKSRRYLDCHLSNDISQSVEKRSITLNKSINIAQEELVHYLVTTWKKRVSIPNKRMIEKLNAMLK